ncbi:hypothetical protein SDJN02_24298, partial [Cucurbita argyrosperma subsp. argyrosperma]
MSVTYRFNEITPPVPEARGDSSALPPPHSDSGLQQRTMPSKSGIPPSNNRNIGYDHELGCMFTPALNDTHRRLPSLRGIGFHEGPLSGRSNEMKVCRQFQRRRKCAYGDQCRYLHENPEKTRAFGSSTQNYEVRIVDSGHVMDRRRGLNQLEEVRSKVQTEIVVRELQKLEPFIASQRGSVSDASATTSAATQAEIGTVCKNEEPRMKQFFKSKKSKRLIAIYADWLED